MDANVKVILPRAEAILNVLLCASAVPLSDADVMAAWEADFMLFITTTDLADDIGNEVLNGRSVCEPSDDVPTELELRSTLLSSLKVMQSKVRQSLKARVTSMSRKPLLYRLSAALGLSDGEVAALMYLMLWDLGFRDHGVHRIPELFLCQMFAGLPVAELVHFLSPSRPHIKQQLVEEASADHASVFDFRLDVSFVLAKALYGAKLTLDDVVKIDGSVLADIAREDNSALCIPDMQESGPDGEGAGDDHNGDHEADQDDPEDGSPTPDLSAYPDASNVIELLSHLRAEGNNVAGGDASENEGTPAALNGLEDCIDSEQDKPYYDDVDYLAGGFEVVWAACRVEDERRNIYDYRTTQEKRTAQNSVRETSHKHAEALARFQSRRFATKKNGRFVPRLEKLVEKMKLSQFEHMVILSLVGKEISQRVGRFFGGDTRVCELLRIFNAGDFRKEINARTAFYRSGTLVRSGIMTLKWDSGMNLGDSVCELDQLILDYISGLNTMLDEIIESARCYTPRVELSSVILPQKTKDIVVQRATNFSDLRTFRRDIGLDDVVQYGKGLVFLFHGKPGTGKTLFGNAVASHLGMKILLVDYTSVMRHSSEDDSFQVVFREAKIHNAIVFIDECDGMFEKREDGAELVTAAIRGMEMFDGIIIFATNRPHVLDEAMHRRISLSVALEMPDARDRLAIWKKHLPEKRKLSDDVDLNVLSLEFELTGGYIKNAVFQALTDAVQRAKETRESVGQPFDCSQDRPSRLSSAEVIVTLDDLRNASRLQLRNEIDIADPERQKIPTSGLSQLVASPGVLSSLEQVVAAEKGRSKLFTQWGLTDMRGDASFLIITGPLGCGKKFAASCVAFELGRPTHVVTVSELVAEQDDEVHVNYVPQSAALARAVLVVKNAERLFVKPETVASASCFGRVAEYLQAYDGLVVLCCRVDRVGPGHPLSSPAIPDSVLQLLPFIVSMDVSSVELRASLWRRLIPKDLPVDSNVSAGLDKLAKEYIFSGSTILSCIRPAGMMACSRAQRTDLLVEDQSVVTLKDFTSACEAMAKLISPSA